MFVKSIDRDLKGVIKVEQNDDSSAYQELDEYVVTKELNKHLGDFFSSYKKGINGNTDAMGVWVSGFFGSGKSHFLKIISYLLANREISGKEAISFFVDDKKVTDSFISADIQLAGRSSTDVILFNIDSKSSVNSKVNKEAILDVFVRVFNEMQGFCSSYPFIAELERKLTRDGKYEEFESEFFALTGNQWKDVRDDFYFIQDSVVDALVKTGIMTDEAARNWCANADDNYVQSISSFAALVSDYCKSKGPNHHVTFLVDEIGQYIGEDSQLMLNLQTLTEDLGTKCKGKVWIVVTSQQDIDSITKVKGNDFSKIQGRFDTRLSLSSANVGEVIRLRLLSKTDAASETLRLLYDEKESVLKNLIVFSQDTAEMKKYSDRNEFAAVYPFIPYQFHLLGVVLKAIREHGASGMHLSEGERSMLALFRESAISAMNEEEGILISFDLFYQALHKFIDHSHATVILNASENSKLEPFDVKVLKTLFMIKYVKEIPPNIENLTTLLIDNVDSSRVDIQKKVSESLKRLIHETLILKNGTSYIFLTNEEQDINRAIDKEVIEPGEIIKEISGIIFDEKLSGIKSASDPRNRSTFSFDRSVDGVYYLNQKKNELGLSLITPANADEYNESNLRSISEKDGIVLVYLKGDVSYLQEIRELLKIKKYATRCGHNTTVPENINDDRLREKNDRIRVYLDDALQNADIYVNGELFSKNSDKPETRIKQVLTKLVEEQYFKLVYMETVPSSSDIQEILRTNRQSSIVEATEGRKPNQQALDDIFLYVKNKMRVQGRITLKSLQDIFTKTPYGYTKTDISWLVASLFADNLLSFKLHGQVLSLVSKNASEIEKYLVKTEYADQLIIEVREKVSQSQIRGVKDVLKEVFGYVPSDDREDALVKVFIQKTDDKITELKKYLDEFRYESGYPGGSVLEKAISEFKAAKSEDNPFSFFDYVNTHKDDLLDLSEDLSPVAGFFKGEQKGIFKRSLDALKRFDSSRTYITDNEISDYAEKIREIVINENPYSDIYRLPSLEDSFNKKYDELLKKEKERIKSIIESDEKLVKDYTEGKYFADSHVIESISRKFFDLKNSLLDSDDIKDAIGCSTESDVLKTRCMNDIDAAVTSKPNIKPSGTSMAGTVTETNTVIVPQKSVRSIGMRSLGEGLKTRFETDKDIDDFLAGLRKKLVNMLSDSDDIIIQLK